MIDLGCDDAVRRPAEWFGRLLTEGDVHRSASPAGWAVVGHAAVSDAFADARTLSADRISVLERVAADRPEEFRLVVDLLAGWMIFRDPPEHTRLREPVRASFSPRRVADLDETIERIVHEACDAMEAGAVDGVGDVYHHVAVQVPARVIGALLGIHGADRDRLHEWSDQLAQIVFSTDQRAVEVDGVVAAARSFEAYFADVVDRERGGDGIIGRVAALDTSFRRIELIGMCTLLLFAGHETTAGLIGQMVPTLQDRPDLLAELHDGADLDRAVDEFLRVLGPARTMFRKVAVDHERAGVPMRRGETVLLSIAGANHDPRVFDEPGSIDLRRHPNPHLGFGWGLHHCLGANLARREAAVVLRVLTERYPELRPAQPVAPLVGSVLGFGRAGEITLAV